VGALKQANVGLALLSGYGNTNTTGVDGTTEEKAGGSTAEDELNNQSQLLKTRSARATAKVQKLLNEKRLELTQKVQKEWLQEALAARKAKGESGVFMYVVVGVGVGGGGGGGGVVGGGVWCSLCSSCSSCCCCSSCTLAFCFCRYGYAVKDATLRMNRELQLENQRLRKLHGNVFDSKGGTPSVESLLDEAGGVRLL